MKVFYKKNLAIRHRATKKILLSVAKIIISAISTFSVISTEGRNLSVLEYCKNLIRFGVLSLCLCGFVRGFLYTLAALRQPERFGNIAGQYSGLEF